MNLQPPPSRKEYEDLCLAFRHNIEKIEFINNEAWYNNWGTYLIGLRRGYQQRFLSEAYNEHSTQS